MTTTLLQTFTADGKIHEIWEESLGAGLNKGTRTYEVLKDIPVVPEPEPVTDPMQEIKDKLDAIEAKIDEGNNTTKAMAVSAGVMVEPLEKSVL